MNYRKTCTNDIVNNSDIILGQSWNSAIMV